MSDFVGTGVPLKLSSGKTIEVKPLSIRNMSRLINRLPEFLAVLESGDEADPMEVLSSLFGGDEFVRAFGFVISLITDFTEEEAMDIDVVDASEILVVFSESYDMERLRANFTKLMPKSWMGAFSDMMPKMPSDLTQGQSREEAQPIQK